MTTYNPFAFTRFSYANGLGITNHAVAPDTKVNIAAGSIRDSTDTFQIISTASITVDTDVVGLNGIDTGVLAASKVYAVFVISDPITQQTTGGLVSLSYTAPVMPYGYSAFALVGYIVTDSSADFLLGYWTTNNTGNRLFMYDAPQATSITAGAATSYTAITLTTLVPTADNLPVWVYSDITPSAAARQLFLQPTGAVGDAVIITGQVATVHVTSNSLVLAKLSSSVPKISYKWTAGGGDAAAISIAGYEFYI